MKSQVNPVIAVVVIVVFVVVALAIVAMKTGRNTKRLDTGLNTEQMEKDPASARNRLANEVQKYNETKGKK